MSATRIANWSVTDRCPFAPYRAPELDPHLHLEGDVAGRGGPIVTTRIVRADGLIVSKAVVTKILAWGWEKSRVTARSFSIAASSIDA